VRPSLLLLVAALGMMPGVGCTLRLPAGENTAPPAAPVALVTGGSAFARPGVKEQVARAVRQVSGRRVLLLAESANAPNDPRRRLAARLAKENPPLASYDWRESQCAAEADVLLAFASNTDAVYRVVLDATTHTRPVTDADLASQAARNRGLPGILATVRGDQPRAVREESIDGDVTLSVFAPDSSLARVPIGGRAARFEPGAPRTLLDPAEMAARALRKLPRPRAPSWEAHARRLVGAGCPLLAMAVAEARLGTGTTFRGVRSAALAAMRRNVDRRAARVSGPDVATRGVSKAPPPEETAPTPPEETCSTLCTMHMVELCNNDRALWIEHRARWEATPCGTRRSDAFLEECYDQQWQSGTFDEACVTPCEKTPEGRDRLLSILQQAGCLPN
jgi:hypothetical protein